MIPRDNTVVGERGLSLTAASRTGKGPAGCLIAGPSRWGYIGRHSMRRPYRMDRRIQCFVNGLF